MTERQSCICKEITITKYSHLLELLLPALRDFLPESLPAALAALLLAALGILRRLLVALNALFDRFNRACPSIVKDHVGTLNM